VNEEHQRFFVDPGQLAQEVPPAVAIGRIGSVVFQLAAGPENGSFGAGVEPFGVEKSPLIVVAQQAHLAFHRKIDALAGVGPVSDHIAQAVHLLDALLANIVQHGCESFQVAVDIADQCTFHRAETSASAAATTVDYLTPCPKRHYRNTHNVFLQPCSVKSTRATPAKARSVGCGRPVTVRPPQARPRALHLRALPGDPSAAARRWLTLCLTGPVWLPCNKGSSEKVASQLRQNSHIQTSWPPPLLQSRGSRKRGDIACGSFVGVRFRKDSIESPDACRAMSVAAICNFPAGVLMKLAEVVAPGRPMGARLVRQFAQHHGLTGFATINNTVGCKTAKR